MKTRFIFVTGGVVSSLGKGIASASLGALLQARGFRVGLRKLDPYLNIDPGTMSPYQHGEVFITDDGAETDLDLGHYERFTGLSCGQHDYTTTGQIYSSVLGKERKGDYLGATIQVVPHITDEIKHFVLNKSEDYDFVICEIGGTVGDIEGLPHLEAIRQLRNDLGRERTLFVHLTLLPYIPTAGELKTKPTQHSVKELLGVGIQADLLLCRSHTPLDPDVKRKLSQFCNVPHDRVITALDAAHIYQVPLQYHEDGFDEQVCHFFGLDPNEHPINLTPWRQFVDRLIHPVVCVKIGIVGKYVQLPDAYKSLTEALTHACVSHHARLEIHWIDSSAPDLIDQLQQVDGILVPGGFGYRGTEGKIDAITYARTSKTPFLGICFGMQLAIIEAARHLLNLGEASSTEFGPTSEPIVGLLTEWAKDSGIERRDDDAPKGGTMRLGAYPCVIQEGTLAYQVYGASYILERHRHRYEVNLNYLQDLENVGIRCSGKSPDGLLPEIIENTDHPWFMGVQFHPEVKSRPFTPHPLFLGFIEACLKRGH